MVGSVRTPSDTSSPTVLPEAVELASTWKTGDRAHWHHELRGGWGYVELLKVRIDEVRGEKARIVVRLKQGGDKKVWVKLTKLSRLEEDLRGDLTVPAGGAKTGSRSNAAALKDEAC